MLTIELAVVKSCYDILLKWFQYCDTGGTEPSVPACTVNLTSLCIYMNLLGPPEAPRDVTIVAVAAEQAVITWIVGLSGGFPQTFRVLINEKDKTGDQKFYDTGRQNPQNGSLEYFIIPDLSPETEYEIVVRSMNDYNGGSHSDSETKVLISRGTYLMILQPICEKYVSEFCSVWLSFELM